MPPVPAEGERRQLIPAGLAQMQRTQNSLGSALRPPGLLDTNPKLFSLRGGVHLFDPSTSKNQTQQRTMYRPEQMKMGSLGSISSANQSEADRPAGVPLECAERAKGTDLGADPDLLSPRGLPPHLVLEHAFSAITPNDLNHDLNYDVDFSADQKKQNMTLSQIRTNEMVGALQQAFGPRFAPIPIDLGPGRLRTGAASEAVVSERASEIDSAQKVDGGSGARAGAQPQ